MFNFNGINKAEAGTASYCARTKIYKFICNCLDTHYFGQKMPFLRLFLLKFSHVGTHGRASLRQHPQKWLFFALK